MRRAAAISLAFFTACAVMCRSVLEEALKQVLSEPLSRVIRTRYRNAATLGNLLHEVNNNLPQIGIDLGFPPALPTRSMMRVRRLCTRGCCRRKRRAFVYRMRARRSSSCSRNKQGLGNHSVSGFGVALRRQPICVFYTDHSMSYASAIDQLSAMTPELLTQPGKPRRKFSLDEIRILLEALGNPHLQFHRY